RFWRAEGKVDFDGEHYQLNGAKTGPAPCHPIPLWIGAYGPRMLGLTGRSGDGWIPSLSYLPPEKVSDRQARIDEAAEEAGRSPGEIRRGYNLMGHLAAPGVTTKPKAEADGVLTGDVSSWIERIVGYHLELRMDTFIFWPVAGQEREQVQAFAQEVVPAIKEETAKS
ncbi:MAG: LLM class flavin-dependent oxidoreductase, partial [Anaerolineales bacterium]